MHLISIWSRLLYWRWALLLEDVSVWCNRSVLFISSK